MNALPRRILVPVDFDAASRRAVRYARALACALNAEICLVHVVPMPPRQPLSAHDHWWINLAERTLAGLVERARLAPGTTTHVLTGSVPAEIERYAIDNGFDLVILSGHDKADWHGSMLGPTALAILKHARVPMLVVPPARVARESRTEETKREPAAGPARGRLERRHA